MTSSFDFPQLHHKKNKPLMAVVPGNNRVESIQKKKKKTLWLYTIGGVWPAFYKDDGETMTRNIKVVEVYMKWWFTRDQL